MSDELRKLAEICASREPLERNDIEFVDYGSGWVRDQWNYIAAASPDVVLGLLDERDTATALLAQARSEADGQRSRSEKAEAERDRYREAVKRLAGAMEDIRSGTSCLNGYSIDDAVQACAAARDDPVVKRVVEGW